MKYRETKKLSSRNWRASAWGRWKTYLRNKKIYGTPQENAKRQVYIAVRGGHLAHPSDLSCADCGCQAQVYDHRDYSKPLDVVAVCRSCNAKRGPAIKPPPSMESRSGANNKRREPNE